MKPVQVLFDEALLSELDSDDEVEKHGRSRVLQNLVSSYLRDRRQSIVDAQYASGYGGDFKVTDELDGWEEEGERPGE
jgi:hypothetical protein